MLVLTLRIGEGFAVGDDTWVECLEMRSGQVKIGIACPRDRKVLREVHVREEQKAQILEAAARGHAREEFHK